MIAISRCNLNAPPHILKENKASCECAGFFFLHVERAILLWAQDLPGTALTWLDLVRKVEGRRVDIGKVINSVCQGPGQSQAFFCAARNANEITGF